MASPELEDGFTRIANGLLEALARHPFSKRHYAVLLAVVRLSYGYGAKVARASSARLSELTGIAPNHCREAVRELEAMGVLRSQQGPEGKTLAIVKHFDRWRSDPAEGRPKMGRGGGLKQAGKEAQNRPTYTESKESLSVGSGSLRQQQEGGTSETLIFPRQLSDEERNQASAWLTGMNGTAQAILDVVAANIKAGTVKKSPLSLLRALIASDRAGTFDPSPGLHIAAQRARRQKEEAERKTTHATRNTPQDPERIARNAQMVADAKKAIYQPRSKPE